MSVPQWADVSDLTVHPQAHLVPAMDPDSDDALVEDIAAHGIQVPLDVTAGGVVLDGRHRLRIAIALGHAGVPVRVVDPDGDEVGYMIRMALRRRHLTTEQRKNLAATLLRNQPERSDRSVARETGISPTTVGDVRRDAETSGQLSKVDSRLGDDGRVRALPEPRPVPVVEVDPLAGMDQQQRAVYGALRGIADKRAELERRDPSEMTPPIEAQRRIARAHLLERLAMARGDADLCDGRLSQDDMDAVAGHLEYIRWRLFRIEDGRASLAEVTHVS